MLFKSIAAAAFLAATVVADGAAIVKSLNTVDADIAKLNGTVLAFDGNLFKALPILGASTTLQNDLKAGTKTAQQSANLTNDETFALIDPVGRLNNDANITVSNLIKKKPEFQKLFLTGIIKLVLQDTKKDATAYANAIIAKVPEFLQDTARSLVAPLNAGFDQAIAAYSS